MSAAGEVVTQLTGDPAAAKRGWLGLRPKPDNNAGVWSVFLGRMLKPDEGQTVVESLGTLVHEGTLRILPYRKGTQKDRPETVLGHAAAAHGTSLDVAEIVFDLRKEVIGLREEIAALRAEVKK